MKMKDVFSRFDMMRVLRFVLGLVMVWLAIDTRFYVLLFFAALLLLQAVFNVSCCGAGGCSGGGSGRQLYKDEIDEYKPGRE